MQQRVYLTHSLKTMVLRLDFTLTYLLSIKISDGSEISEHVVLYTGEFVRLYYRFFCLFFWPFLSNIERTWPSFGMPLVRR